jgi:hypothetical protein
MGFEVPVYAKALRAALSERRLNADGKSARKAPISPRWSERLFRRTTPTTTFQRCLAVHMHFAQHHSALD